MTYAIKPDKGHIVVYINGVFYCSVDNWKEAEEELRNYVNERSGNYETKNTQQKLWSNRTL